MARYGHQPLDVILGRRPTRFEWSLFSEALQKILDKEFASPTTNAPGDA